MRQDTDVLRLVLLYMVKFSILQQQTAQQISLIARAPRFKVQDVRMRSKK